jgi:hypothetical protein
VPRGEGDDSRSGDAHTLRNRENQPLLATVVAAAGHRCRFEEAVMLLIVTQHSALLHRPVALRVDRSPAPSRVPSRLTAAMTD